MTRITDSANVPRTLEEIWTSYEETYDEHNPLEAVVQKTWERVALSSRQETDLPQTITVSTGTQSGPCSTISSWRGSVCLTISLDQGALSLPLAVRRMLPRPKCERKYRLTRFAAESFP